MFDQPSQPHGFNFPNSVYYLMQKNAQQYYFIQYQQINNFYGHPESPLKPKYQLELAQPAITTSEFHAIDRNDVEALDLHAKNDNHDYDNCAECRQAMTYLLTPPDLQDIYPEAYECTLNAYSLFDQNLKLFDNLKVQKVIEIKNVGFNFAPFKRFSMGFQENSFDESCMIGEIDSFANNNDITSCCDTTSEFDEIWLEKDLQISPFTPKVNSTFIGKKHEDSVKKTPWKKAIVLDPKLSPPYNNAFPSLDLSEKKIQEKRVTHNGNGVSKKTIK